MLELALTSPWPGAPVLLTAASLIAGCVVAVVAVYLVVLAVAALVAPRGAVVAPRGAVVASPGGVGAPRAPGRVAPTARLVVLIPAHDEAELVGRCIRSLLAQSYPAELYEIAVVADNCTDDTAAIAAAAGAHMVMERHAPDARGKGRALRWAMDQLLPERSDVDALVVVDADSIADREFLTALVQPFAAGAPAAQGESLLYGDGGAGAELRVAAFLLVNRVRPTGRAALGLPATHLAGNGMLLGRETLLARPWGAFTSAEDLEYSLDLQMSGLKIAFARGAVLLSPTAPNAHAASQQQLRWEGGKVHLARQRIPRLIAAALRDHNPGLLGIAFELAIPPLGFIAAAAGAGLAASLALWLAALVPIAAVAPWMLASAAIPAFVLIGLRAAGASRTAYRALLRAPLFILMKPLRARRVYSFQGDTWVRTERAGAAEARSEA